MHLVKTSRNVYCPLFIGTYGTPFSSFDIQRSRLPSVSFATFPQQRNILDHLRALGIRDKYCVLIGGACTSQEWADEIGADGYGETGGDAVAMALEALAQKSMENSQ